jgi:TRAP-type C4-dicarboxylate transport system permease small subunit
MKKKNLFDKIIDGIGAFLMFSIIVVTFYQVMIRYVFKAPSTWSEEFARYLMIWMTMIGAAMALHSKEHVWIDTFIKFLSQRMKKIYKYFYFICLIFFMIFICYYGFSFALLNSSQKSPTTPWLSMFWPCISIPIGMGLMIYYILMETIKGKN